MAARGSKTRAFTPERVATEGHPYSCDLKNPTVEARRALQNLYELPLEQNSDLQQQIEASLNRETSEDDTHPCPNDRFRLTRRVAGTNESPATGMVWDLFKNREALTNEMTSLIQSEVHSA